MTASVIVIVLLLAFEVYVRVVEDQLPLVRAGDAAEMIIKARQIDDLVATHGSEVDVVFFGTSMMDSATSPSTFLATSTAADSAYNAAVVGAPLATQIRWGDEVVLDQLDPDVIVLGIHPIDLLLSDVLNLNIRPEQADIIFARVLRETDSSPLAAVDRYLNDEIATVRHRGSLRRPRTMWDATWRRVTGEDPPRFLELRDEAFWEENLGPLGESYQFAADEFRITGVSERLRQNMQVDRLSTHDLRRLLDAMEEHDAQVVVVIPPVPMDAWVTIGVDLEAVRTGVAMIREQAEARGMAVVDFSEAGYPNELFADLVHSNGAGAARFSSDLARVLDEMGR